MRVARTWLVLGLLWCALSSGARAQDDRDAADVPDPDEVGASADQVKAEAQALFQAGRLAYEGGRYEEALERFRAAHELSDLPPMLYNVALAADRARYDELALEYYERFLAEAEPDATTRRRVEARMAGLRRALERRDAQQARAQDVPTPEEAAHAGAAEDEPSAEEAVPAPSEAATQEDGSGLSGWAWVGIGGGVLAVGAAVLTAVLVTRDDGGIVPGDYGVVVTTLGAP